MRTAFDKLAEAKEKRQALIDRTEELVNTAKTRTLTSQERSEFKGIEREVEELVENINELEQEERARKRKASALFGESGSFEEEDYTTLFKGKKSGTFNFEIQKRAPVNKSAPIQDFVLRNFDVHEDLQKADVFSCMAALATGQTKDPRTKKAIEHVKSGVNGSAMLTEFLSAQLLDGGLSHSHLAKSGMNVFTMVEPTQRFVKIDTYPTFEWKAEQASTTDRTVVFSSVDFEAKTLRGFVNVSGEQLQDAHNINKSLRQVFSRSMGNSIDTAGLYGSGVGAEPLGIVNYTNVNSYDNDGLILSYDPFIYAMKEVADDNGDPEQTFDTWIMNPATWRDLNLLKDGDDNPLQRPPVLSSHRFLHTTKTPENLLTPGNRTSIVGGGFRSLNLGVRLQTEIMITPVQSDKFQYSFFVVFRGDFQPTREQDFAVITDVYAPDIIT